MRWRERSLPEGAVHRAAIQGNPDPDLINTSFAERQNLTMRMSMRRFTRLTNAFSKKFENPCHALALYFVFHNFCRVHKTLGVTPAMAAGVVDTVMNMTEVARMVDEAAMRTTIQKRVAAHALPQSH